MKTNWIFFTFCIVLQAQSQLGQVSQLNTGTTKHLMDVSVMDTHIVICGFSDYLVKSNDECKTLSHITRPWPANYFTRMVSVKNNTAFLLAYTSSQALLYKSTDGGNTWNLKLDTAGTFNQGIGFFDANEGFLWQGKYTMRTTDGGSTWTPGTNFTFLGITAIKTDGDSMVCVGGFNISGGSFKLSKDRGYTWPYTWGFWSDPIDFFFLNKDTIIGISIKGAFAKSTDGGLNWDSSSQPPINYAYGLYFKNAGEGYMIGANSQTIGVVLKTTDLGKTWSVFNTGIKSMLRNMTVLNDSIALLNGSEGVLLRWNYKQTVFTSIGENYFDKAGLKIFPNPVSDKLHFEFNEQLAVDIKLSIHNTLGQSVYSQEKAKSDEELDLSFLQSGLYFVRLESEKGQKVVKILKE